MEDDNYFSQFFKEEKTKKSVLYIEDFRPKLINRTSIDKQIIVALFALDGITFRNIADIFHLEFNMDVTRQRISDCYYYTLKGEVYSFTELNVSRPKLPYSYEIQLLDWITEMKSSKSALMLDAIAVKTSELFVLSQENFKFFLDNIEDIPLNFQNFAEMSLNNKEFRSYIKRLVKQSGYKISKANSVDYQHAFISPIDLLRFSWQLTALHDVLSENFSDDFVDPRKDDECI
ncbi:hypothetical protein TVAG_272840 [Trichomonas vaginalis G3]|uniref:Uncharacterized protein n=1 Tax=Trichomonas vaginalis (strain ATCC PRA-98 / G3) TaxID=412133 RepID=A2F0G4_TRIV3|nr:hypothetical protein TVAGG3_0153920 [Trichomonas vaginalis G3]EAY01601.1 hypothetical protein TVAG_272840 [Trichomonas vaginalis G3]KAI5547444.1 hypothetical protein TVAGG3_0153920 [Trichomonas vaginalis G3]|eukprot:XP_001330340.1 hypothetical protein [Trichomonas vaginalis G3]